MNAPVTLAAGNGQSHTHAITLKDGRKNPFDKAGQPYPAITLDRVSAMVADPSSLEKDEALWFIPSAYSEHDARCHDTQRERGMFHCLPVDIDCNDLSLADVQEAVRAVIGDAAALYYSTRSAKAEDRKWRVLIPLATPVSGADYKDTQDALFDLLEQKSGGVLTPDRALNRAAQLVYLPNRGASGFYEFALPDASAPVLELTPDSAIMVQRKANAEARQRAKQEAKAAAERRADKRKAEAAGGDGSILERYNAAHCIADLLARYGYERDGRTNDWRSPFQTSGSYATRDYGDYWLSLSGSDASAGIGAQTRSGHRHGDAFDLFVHHEHGGDFKAAQRAYAQEIKPPRPGGMSDGGATATKSSSAFHFVSVGDLSYRTPEFLIDGLIETESLGVVFGDPGSGKSFMAVDLALSVATGTQFHGRGVRQGPVFLIAGEGHNGLTRRFAAWSIYKGVSIESAPLFVSNRPAQFLDAESAATVTEAVRELAAHHGKPALIAIDTLARNYGPGDENSTSDMSAFVAAVDNLKAEFSGCAVALVHHTGHADKKRGRGAIALKGALDWEYLVEKTDKLIRLTSTKMKDAELPAPLAFTLESVTLRDGASSAALRETEAPSRTTRLKGKDQVAMTALTEALGKYGRTDMGPDYPRGVKVVSIEQWRSACAAHELTTGSSDSAARTAFMRAKDRLIDHDLVRGFNNHFWKVRGDE